MSVSIKELIAKREEIKARKSQKLTIQTSIGEVVAKKPTTLLMTEALGLDGDNDEYIVYNCLVEPNLKDKDLQQAYDCSEPMDIVGKLFEFGEIKAISDVLIKSVGVGKKLDHAIFDEMLHALMDGGPRNAAFGCYIFKRDACVLR